MVAGDLTLLIGGVLATSSILAYLFIMRRIRTKQSNPTDPTVSTKRDEEALAKAGESSELRQQEDSPGKKRTRVAKCDLHYGYLSSLPKESVFPAKCLECGRMARCRNRKKPKRTRSKQIEAVLAID